jgi:SAM-dependent methyltransferase
LDAHKQLALKHASGDSASKPRSTLDLGCGSRIRNPFFAELKYGVDLAADPERNVSAWDGAFEPLPYPDSSMDFVTAFDFLEHVPRIIYWGGGGGGGGGGLEEGERPRRRYPFVELMNEVHRVLKPCGIFFSVTPMYPGSRAFHDPTHVNFMTVDTLVHYFDNELLMAKMYGFKGSFFPDMGSIRMAGEHGHVTMQALKDSCEAPPRDTNDWREGWRAKNHDLYVEPQDELEILLQLKTFDDVGAGATFQ